jgi:hypothetical protein
MTLGPKQEHAMKAKPEQQSPPKDIERFRKELALKIQRLVGESLEAWATCDNKRCRRANRCASRHRECIARWRASLPPLSPEEAAQRLADFRRELDMRSAGLPLGEPPAKAKESRGNKTVATPAKCPAPGGRDREALEPVAGETPPLSPEKQERIDRAWNEHVASQPAELDKAREPGPRITQL